MGVFKSDFSISLVFGYRTYNAILLMVKVQLLRLRQKFPRKVCQLCSANYIRDEALKFVAEVAEDVILRSHFTAHKGSE